MIVDFVGYNNAASTRLLGIELTKAEHRRCLIIVALGIFPKNYPRRG